MTINEEKQLKNYIKGLIRESIEEEHDIDDDTYFGGGLPDDNGKADYDEPDFDAYDAEDDMEGYVPPVPEFMSKEYMKWAQMVADRLMNKFGREVAVDEWRKLTDTDDMEESMRRFTEYWNSHHSLAGRLGLEEVRNLCENMAREAMQNIIEEGKKKTRKKKSGKSNTKNKTVLSKLNSKAVNSADYYYRLYGAKTKKQKAAARSLGYKKAKGERNDNGDPYSFTPAELTRLGSMMGDIGSDSKR